VVELHELKTDRGMADMHAPHAAHEVINLLLEKFPGLFVDELLLISIDLLIYSN
jgi:hypothetical protein